VLNDVGTDPTKQRTLKTPAEDFPHRVKAFQPAHYKPNFPAKVRIINMFEIRNWKSHLLLISISLLALVLLCSALVSTAKLPFLSSSGLLSWLLLLVLTLAASRFTVSITTAVGVSQSRKSVADAVVFLAVILYAVPPAQTAGPATLLAAIVGFVSTYGLTSR
jgi:hypothetical protein